jgi:hypothetical protein
MGQDDDKLLTAVADWNIDFTETIEDEADR